MGIRKVHLVKWYETKGDLHKAIMSYANGERNKGELLELGWIAEHFHCDVLADDLLSDVEHDEAKRYLAAIDQFCLDNMVIAKDVIVHYSW